MRDDGNGQTYRVRSAPLFLLRGSGFTDRCLFTYRNYYALMNVDKIGRRGKKKERVKEMDNVRQARTTRLVQFGVLANKINGYRYGVPKSVISELVDYRLKLAAMQDDEELRDIAANLMEVTELLIDYAKSLNSGEKAKASELMAQAIAKWDANDKVIERMMGNV